MTLKRKLLLACAGVAAVIAAVVLAPPKGSETPPEATEPMQAAAALTVSLETPQIEVWPEEVRANGWLAAWQDVVISAQIGGQMIESVNASVGDTVAKGDVLSRFSRGSLENDVQQLEAALESARASLELATADADRARKLSSNSAISQQQAAEYLSTERKAKADVSSAEAQLASARLDLDHTDVIAVTGGVISSRSAAVGDVVTAGEELFRLVRDGRVEWQAEVPLNQLRQIEVGTPVSVPTPQGDISGVVRRIAPSVSESNGRVIVYVSLTPPDATVQPKTGIMISGIFKVGESEALFVSSSAVVMQDGFSYVFALEHGETPTVSRIRVETGRRQDDRVEILSGVSKDMQIVQSGGAFLSDGSVVRIAGADAAPDNTDTAETDQ